MRRLRVHVHGGKQSQATSLSPEAEKEPGGRLLGHTLLCFISSAFISGPSVHGH